MIISRTPIGPRTSTPSRPAWVAILATGSLVLGLGAALGGFAAGVAFREHVQPELVASTGRVRAREILPALLAAPGNALRALASRRPVPEMSIDVSFRNLQKLRQKRAEAIASRVLVSSSEDLVPARIRHEGRSIRVKLRLKGDLPDHFEGDKWSLRIHVRDGDQLFGMRRLSIQDPSTRGFQTEPLILEHLRREGVIAPRYFLVDVTLNGSDVGLMAVEEHFSKELLESQQRREGVIVHLDEEPFFRNLQLNGNFGPYSNPFLATVRSFRTAQTENSPALRSQLETATGLLRGFLAGALPASAVFDVDRLARFMAVVEVWNAGHALAWHNLRFYLDPITERLEPIGFDVGSNLRFESGLVSRRQEIASRCLDDPVVRAAFVGHLRRIAAGFVSGDGREQVRRHEAPLLRVLHREFPFRASVDLDALVARSEQLARIDLENFPLYEPHLGHPGMAYPSPLQAYLYRDAAGARIEFVNVLPVAVTVTSLRVPDAGSDLAGGGSLLADRLPLRIPPTEHMRAPTRLVLQLDPPANGAPFEVEGTASVAGQAGERAFRAEAYFPPLGRSPIPTASLAEAIERHPFLDWDAERGSLRARPGSWDVVGSLVLPEGAGLLVGPATELRFGDGEALIARGPLVFAGSAERPIVLRGRGASGPWAGIVALSSDGPHDWRHVLVRDTTGIDRDGWTLTGGVTLRAARVDLSHTRFEGSRAEDALNLVQSSFRLEEVEFSDTASDALDADHSTGTIQGGRYLRIGGDAIDVSGAQVEIAGTRIETVRDKALSVGEASRVRARDLRIEGVGTAAVSKDRSELILEDSEISDASVAGIMAYVKKPEYGPSSVSARGIAMRRVWNPALAQTGSRIVLDGREIEAQRLDVEELYTTGPMRK